MMNVLFLSVVIAAQLTCDTAALFSEKSDPKCLQEASQKIRDSKVSLRVKYLAQSALTFGTVKPDKGLLASLCYQGGRLSQEMGEMYSRLMDSSKRANDKIDFTTILDQVSKNTRSFENAMESQCKSALGNTEGALRAFSEMRAFWYKVFEQVTSR